MSLIDPVSDPDELANARRFVDAASIFEFRPQKRQIVRDEDGAIETDRRIDTRSVRRVADPAGRTIGIRIGEESTTHGTDLDPSNASALASKTRRTLAAEFGQANRVVVVLCKFSYRDGQCRQVLARWKIVKGNMRLSEDDWKQAKRVLGAETFPVASWLYDEVSDQFYREYWNGPVKVVCKRHKRPASINLASVRAKLHERDTAETIRMFVSSRE